MEFEKEENKNKSNKEISKKNTKQKHNDEDSIIGRLARWEYTKEQIQELHEMLDIGMSNEEILTIFYPETKVEKMKEIREMYQAIKKKA